MKRIIGAAAAVAFAAGAAAAQEQQAGAPQGEGLGTDDAEAFLMSLGDEAQSAVAEGDWQGIATWISDHVADEAPVRLNGEFVMTGGPSGSYEVAMTGADLQRFARMSAMGPQQQGLYEAMSDYQLDVRVDGTWQVPGGQVGAAATITETGRIDLAAMQGGAGAEAGGTTETMRVFSGMATCAMRLSGSEGNVTIETMICDGASVL